MEKSNIWAIIPAYNEGKSIGRVIEDAKKFCSHIVVIDDKSRDDTYDKAVGKGADVLRHIVNLGKGGAMLTGCEYALGKGAEAMIVIDADGQHDPQEIPNFIKAIEEGNSIVFGYRKLSRKMPAVLKLGNITITFFARLLYGIDLRDTQCGYRAFTAEAYRKIRWKANDYSVESEMIANAGKSHLKYKEIPIETIYSDKYKGTTIMDGIKIVFNMLMWRFGR